MCLNSSMASTFANSSISLSSIFPCLCCGLAASWSAASFMYWSGWAFLRWSWMPRKVAETLGHKSKENLGKLSEPTAVIKSAVPDLGNCCYPFSFQQFTTSPRTWRHKVYLVSLLTKAIVSLVYQSLTHLSSSMLSRLSVFGWKMQASSQSITCTASQAD